SGAASPRPQPSRTVISLKGGTVVKQEQAKGTVTTLADLLPPGDLKAVYQYRDLREGLWWDVATSSHGSAAAELKALDEAFLKLSQVPYNPSGPNSNTYARVLLERAGFKVADRYEDTQETVGWGLRGGAKYRAEPSWIPKNSYAQERPRQVIEQ